MSQNKNTSTMLWGAVALGAIGVLVSYRAAGLERFWANWVLVNGKNNMPSHAPYLSESERWAVVHYVRALQRAQNAKDEDLKVPTTGAGIR